MKNKFNYMSLNITSLNFYSLVFDLTGYPNHSKLTLEIKKEKIT